MPIKIITVKSTTATTVSAEMTDGEGDYFVGETLTLYNSDKSAVIGTAVITGNPSPSTPEEIPVAIFTGLSPETTYYVYYDSATGHVKATTTEDDPKVATESMWADLASKVKAKADASAVPTVAQTTGTSTTDVMSQNAVTSMVFADGANAQKVAIGAQSTYSPNSYSTSIGYNALAGNYSVAIGGSDSASTRTQGIGGYSIAIGNNAKSNQSWGIALGASAKINAARSIAIGQEATTNGAASIAIGSQSTTTSKGEVSFGGISLAGEGYNNSQYRLLTNIYDPQSAHDAATKGYVDTVAPTITMTDTDPGEGATLATNSFIGVYDA